MSSRFRYILILFCCGLFSVTTTFAQQLRKHKVKTGDTPLLLTDIYEVTIADLMALNKNLNDSLVQGKTIIIPETYRLSEPVQLPKQVFSRIKTHKVKKGETLIGISKKYNLDQAVILAFNGELSSQGLRRGMKLKIPVYRTEMVLSYLGNSLKTYTVQPKEGKWRIAQKFGISIPQLENINPDLPETLTVGLIINVPNIEAVDLDAEDLNYFYYEVPAKVGFFKLEQTLGFTEAEITEWNPIIKDKGLMAGMVLKLPKPVLEQPEMAAEEQNNTIALDFTDLSEKKLAVILPFQLDNYKLEDIEVLKGVFSNRSFLGLSLDFYSGMILALEDAKAVGLRVSVDVFDSGVDQVTLNKVLNSKYFGAFDAVIGPINPDLFEITSSRMNAMDVPCIAPFNFPKVSRKNVYQSVPSDLQLKEALLAQLQNDSSIDKVLVISDRSHQVVSKELKGLFPQAQLIYSSLDKDGADSFFITLEDVEKNLIQGHNLVILETDNIGFASNVASVLNGLISPVRSITLATTDFNAAFENENFSNSYKSNLKLRYATSNKPMDTLGSADFIERYQERYHVYPNKYAIRAYDLTIDLLYRLGMYGGLDQSVGNLTAAKTLENKFNYQKLPDGGFTNVSCFVVAYDNYEIKVIAE